MKPFNVIGSSILAICALFVSTANLYAQSSVQIPTNWSRYNGGTAYSIAVPPTVELRDARDAYSQTLRRLNLNYNGGGVVFQQKGLARQEQSAYNKYCRIMIQYVHGNYGEYLNSTETETLDSEWKAVLDQLVSNNVGTAARLIGSYSYKWTTINGAKCVQIDYRRTGSNFDVTIPVVCRMAIFQNNNEMVIMTLSYREKEAGLWKADFEKVFKSFRWI